MATENKEEIGKQVLACFNSLKNVKGVSDKLNMDAKKVRRYLRLAGTYVSKIKSKNPESNKVVQPAVQPAKQVTPKK